MKRPGMVAMLRFLETVEAVIAAQGWLERLQNRRETLQKMKARLERGHYVFAAPWSPLTAARR